MEKVTPDQPEDHADMLELINAEVSSSLARQADSAARVDTKAVLLVGYAGAAASFLASRHAQSVLATFAYIAYGMAAGFGIWAYGLRSYRQVPEPRSLYDEYWTRPKAHALAALAAERVVAFEGNAQKHWQKARLWWASLASLALGMTLTILALNSAHL